MLSILMSFPCDRGGAIELERAASDRCFDASTMVLSEARGLWLFLVKGVPHDLVKAYMWFAIAGSGKFPDAQPNLEGLTAEMTEHQISEAQSLALEWLKRQPRDPEKSLDHIYYKPQ